MTTNIEHGLHRAIVEERLPYMYPDRYRTMPVEAAEILRLADILCGAACEHYNQSEPAEALGATPFQRSPAWSFDALSKALNAYYDARHAS